MFGVCEFWIEGDAENFGMQGVWNGLIVDCDEWSEAVFSWIWSEDGERTFVWIQFEVVGNSPIVY